MRRFFTDRTPPSNVELAATYDSYAPRWLRQVGKVGGMLNINSWRDDMVRLLRGDVLEIGVAAGDTLVRIKSYGEAVTSFTGIDISPGMIAEARKIAQELDIPVSLQVGDAQELSGFADESFDTVTASLTLCTIPDVPKLLSEFTRVLRPGGRVVLIEHVLSPNPVIGWFQKVIAPWHVRRMGCHLDRTTVELVQESGYRIDEERRKYFGVMRFVVASPPENAR